MNNKIRSIVLITALMSWTASIPANAQVSGATIAVVDMEVVGQEYVRFREATKALEQRKLQLQKIVNDEEQSVLAMIKKLEASRSTISQEKLLEMRQEIEQRDRDLREFVAETNYRFRDDLDSLQIRSRMEIAGVVKDISEKDGVRLVLEKGMAIYSHDSLDITARLVAILNERFKPLSGTESFGSGTTSDGIKPKSSPTAFPPPEGPAGKNWLFK